MSREEKRELNQKESSAPVISVRSLCAAYSGRVVLENVSFDVPRGQIVTILGTSGCGKSTLLKHMIGLYRPLSGDVLIEGESLVHADAGQKRRIMSRFGVAYQGGALFRSYSVFENIALPLQENTSLSAKEIRDRVEELLSMVNLSGYGGYMPSDLSGGMVKRAAFARAMALDPELLFFDEPSAGLDPLSSESLDKLILEIRKNTHATIVMVTHELPSIFTVADRAIMLSAEKKGILDDGPPAFLRDHSENHFVREFMNRGRI